MKKIFFVAPVATRSGYGDRARDLAKALLSFEDEYDLKIGPTNWGNTPWSGLDDDTEINQKIKRCLVEGIDYKPDIFIQLTIPNEFTNPGKFNIGVTAGIETDICATNWLEGANKMDMVIGSSQHSLFALKNTKYATHDKATNQQVGTLQLRDNLKTDVLFEGYDTSVFKKLTQDQVKDYQDISNSLDSIKEEFCFLFVGHWLQGDFGHDRKDLGALIKVFTDTFAAKPPSTRPALILKTSSADFSVLDRSDIIKKIRAIQDGIKNPPAIYLLHGSLSAEEMNALYNHKKVKAMISLTHGEGWNRTPLEFSAIGKPIIMPNWSGHLDYMNPEFTTLLPGQLTKTHPSTHNDWIIKDSQWFTVDYGYASAVMKDVMDNYKKYLDNGKKQKKYVESNLTFDHMRDRLKNILDSIELPTQHAINLPKLKKVT